MAKKKAANKNKVGKGSPPQAKTPSKVIKITNLIILAGLVILLFYAPFFRGLYFNEEMATTFLYSGILFFVYITNRIMKKDFKLFKSPLDIAAAVLVLAYAIPVMLGLAASAQGAWDKLLRYINYFFIFIMCRDIIKEDKNIKILLNAIIVSAIGVCILGIDAGSGSGLTNKINWFWQSVPVWLHLKPGLSNLMTFKFFGGYAEGRIFSTLQYPNVLASYLGAVFLLTVGLNMTTESIWKRAWYGAAGFIVFYTFIMAGSRGMVLVLPLMVLLLFLSFWNKQLTISFIVDAIIPAVLGVAVSILYNNYVNIGQYSKVWLSIALGVIVSAVFTALMRYSKRILTKISIKIYLAAAAGIAILVMLAIGIALNIEEPMVIKHSANEANSDKTVIRDITKVKPSNKYVLNFDIDAKSSAGAQYAYKVIIYSIDKFVQTQELTEISGQNDKGSKKLEFTTLPGTKNIRIQMFNSSKGTSAAFSNFKLIDNTTGKSERIIAQYKYLPTDLVYKIKDINLQTHNAWERLIFVKDAFKIIGTHPFGTGGGGWKALYHGYQSYAYSSNEVHDYPVQLCVETGIQGLLVLICMLGIIVHHYRKIRIGATELTNENLNKIAITGVIFTAIASLYAHSVIDFDFSLSAIPIVAWALTGIISGVYAFGSDLKEFEIKPAVNITGTFAVAIAAIVLFCAGFSSVYGRNLIAKASIYENSFKTSKVSKSEAAKVLPDVLAIYKNYLQYQPLDEDGRQKYIQYLNIYGSVTNNMSQDMADYFMKEMQSNVDVGVKNEPYSFPALSTAASYYISANDYKTAFDYIDSITEGARLIGSAYQTKAQLYMMAEEAAEKSGNADLAKQCLKKVIGVKSDINQANKQSMKPIEVPAEIDSIIGNAQKKLTVLGGA